METQTKWSIDKTHSEIELMNLGAKDATMELENSDKLKK